MTIARICWEMMRSSIRAEMQYRMNFLTEVLFDLGYQTIGFAFIWTVVGKFSSLGSWSLGDVTLLYGIQLAGSSLWALSFSRLMLVNMLVLDGTYDQMLLRPVPISLQFMFGGFRIATVGDVLGAIVLLGVGLNAADITWSIPKGVFLILAILGSGMIRGAFELVPAALSFRLLGAGKAGFAISTIFQQFGTYPLDIFSHRLRAFLTFLLPIAFVGWIPASILLDRADSLPIPVWVAWTSPLLGVALLALAWWFFLNESRHYQSSGT